MKRIIFMCVITCLCLGVTGCSVVKEQKERTESIETESQEESSIEKTIGTEISVDSNAESTESIESTGSTEYETMEQEEMTTVKLGIQVNNYSMTAVFENNSSAESLIKELEKKSITINMHDYGNFEKVGPLGISLPRNDEQITTEPGDIILYQGNQITIYYDTNSWSFTKVAKIENVSQNKLKEILGDGDVTVILSIVKSK